MIAKRLGLRLIPSSGWLRLIPLFPAVLLAAGCIKTTHEVRTYHEIQPIHIAVEVNLKIERELNDFFGDMDRRSSLMRFEDPASASDG